MDLNKILYIHIFIHVFSFLIGGLERLEVYFFSTFCKECSNTVHIIILQKSNFCNVKLCQILIDNSSCSFTN